MRIFGGILIALGIVCAGLSVILLLARALAPRQRGEPVLIYAGLAAACITLGIGSFRARRWARDLTLIGSAYTVAFALTGGPFVIWMIFRMFSTHTRLSGTGGTMGWVVAAPLVFMLIAFLLLPLAFLIFYGRRDVRQTVERLDPTPGWTDRQPLPLLAAALLYASVAISSLPSLIRPVVPIPGMVLTGNPARLFMAVIVVICALIGWGLYRGSRPAWIAALALTAGWLAIVAWTFRDLDLVEVLRAYGSTEEELSFVRSFDMKPWLLAMTSVSAFMWMAYLLWVRKYLPPARDTAPTVP